MDNQKINKEIDSLHKSIGMNVKRIREEKGFSQLDLMLAIKHKSTTIISQAELGKNKHFNIEQLYKIAKVLDCSICDFFRYEKIEGQVTMTTLSMI